MSVITGIEWLFYIKVDGDWELVCGLTSNDVNHTTDFLSTTTRNTGKYSTQIPIKHSYELSFDAVVFEDADLVDKVGYKELREYQDAETLLEWKIEVFNKNYLQTGEAYIRDLQKTGSVDGVLTFSGSLVGEGKLLDAVDTEPPSTPFLNPLTVDSSSTYVQLTWTESTDNFKVAGYEILKNGATTIDVGNVTEYKDYSVLWSQTYSYNVRAYDDAGNYSPYSNKRLITIPIPSGMPTPEYFEFQDGTTIFYQDGTPKELQ